MNSLQNMISEDKSCEILFRLLKIFKVTDHKFLAKLP